MTGIFGTKAGLQYDITLLLQIVVLLLLILAAKYAKDKKLRMHGLTTTTAVVLHTISILVAMIPSFATNSGILLRGAPTLGVAITWIHVLTGTLAEILGIFLVAGWRLQPSMAFCAKRRGLMKTTLALWTVALILGIGFYAYYYL